MILKLYIPVAAAETADVADKTVGDVLRQRAAKHYGGFTEFDGRGGWVDGDDNVITEKVTVLEVAIGENPDVEPETFGKVNARWILRATDEDAVMFTVDGEKFMVDES